MKLALTLEEQSLQFDRCAKLYDKYCTTYPLDLIDEIIKKSKIQPGDEILEIGSGNGEATQFFAQDYPMVCIEPGASLVEICKGKLIKPKKISYYIERFENWNNEGKRFKLIISGQALHWVPLGLRYVKVSQSLNHGGYMGLFWNMYLNDETELCNDLSNLCKQYNVLTFKTEQQVNNQIKAFEQEIIHSGQFSETNLNIFPWQKRYTFDTFLGFLKTGLGYQNLNVEHTNLFNDELKRWFDLSNGFLDLKIHCVLYLSKKADKSL
ncbi:class I SAM-dependent methyltransferase [Fulvivirga sp. 29W222]|uniref:Class I SAM-dependent methyltransferase n=1 Tax=Fulvivirga marina TaxID=2494733 RepID=A0A937FYW9_9BACT|nr:class I SAM-dependent methyltransferase [Fulvivirga marina]MBL6447562.1 class I SAM-dependent methyltransferase [Fulvivirga marina]